jgi:glycosyltransferase involved in cell wall biosynthesis
MKDKSVVSVVVPTFNSDRFLERCLRSVTTQTYENIETIIVDRNSNDRTVLIAKDFGVRVYIIDTNERCAQMNYGVEKAIGKFVYIVGSDFVLEPTVIEEAVKKCEVDGFDAVRIHNTSDPTIGFWAKVRRLERDCYVDDELNVAARFFRKEVFEKVGGYDEELVAAEDYDLHNRLLKHGFKIGSITSKEIHIGEPRSLFEIARKHYYYGKTVKNFLDVNPEKGIKQISPLRPAFIRNRKDFARRPLLTCGFILYQTVRYMAAGLGYISSICGTRYNSER